MRITLQPSFVLHHRPYRESSMIIDLLTKDYGRIAVVARGVRTARSRMRAILQPFVPLLTSWQGKSELQTLCSAEGHGIPMRLQGECLLSALYLNELLMRVLHKHDPHPRLYTIYHETLIELQTQYEPVVAVENKPMSALLLQKTLRIFEKKLLTELGYGLQLQYDIPDGNPFVSENNYRFIPEQGFELWQEAGDCAQALIFSGKSLIALATEDLTDPELLRDARRLMRIALAPLLGSQPLQSRKLFIEVARG